MRNQIPKKLISILLASVLTLSQPFGVLATELQEITETTETVNTELQTSTEQDDAKEPVVNTDNTKENTTVNNSPETPIAGDEENAETEASDNTLDSDLDAETENVVDDSDTEDQVENVELSATNLTQMTKDSIVTISGDMPEDAYFTVEPVEYVTDLETIINENGEESYTYTVSKAYDINLYDGNGETFQPVEHDSTVTVKIQSADLEDLEEKNVYRIEEDERTTEIEVIDQTDNSVTFEAEHFTVYVVGETTINTDTLGVIETVSYGGITWTLYDDGTLIATGDGRSNNAPSDGILYNSFNQYNTQDQITTVVLDCILYKNCKHLFKQGHMTNVVCGQNFSSAYTTSMYGMFSWCSALTSLDLSGWNTTNVTDMEDMFRACENLKSLSISDWDTSNVTNMKEMFWGDNFQSLDLSEWVINSGANVTNIFEFCDFLKIIKAPKTIASNITITLPGLDDYSWHLDNNNDLIADNETAYTNIINSVTNKSHCYIRSDVGTANLVNGASFVAKIKKLVNSSAGYNTNDTTIKTIKCVDTPFTSSTNVATDTSEPVYARLVGNVIELYTDARTVYFNEHMEDMFLNLKALESIDLPGWNTSNVNSMSDTFSNCNSLTSLSDLSDWDVSNVTDMQCMFIGCRALTSINELAEWNTSSLTTARNMFEECNALTSVSALSNWNMSKVKNLAYMFNGCSSITSINGLSNWNTSSVTDTQYMFAGCTKLLSANDLTNWDVSKVKTMNCMFSNCEKLESLNLAGWNTSSVTDTNSIFSFCYALESIDLSGWTINSETNTSGLFYWCNALNIICAPKNIAANITIDLPAKTGYQWYLDDDEPMLEADNKKTYTNIIDDIANKPHKYIRSDIEGFSVAASSTTLKPGQDVSSALDELAENATTVIYSDTISSDLSSAINIAEDGFDPVYARNITLSAGLQYDSAPSAFDHTPNINDAGEKSGTYANNLNYKHPITVQGADALHIKLKYGTEGNWDQLYVFSGNYTGSVDRNMSPAGYDLASGTIGASQYRKFQSGNDTPITAEFDVTGNTVTFAFTSDTSGQYWGYYAEISKAIETDATTAIEISSDADVVYFNPDSSSMFYGLNTIKSMDLSAFNTSKVTTMRNMFYECSALTELALNHFDMSHVTDIDDMFFGCESLKTLDIDQWDVSSVVAMHETFKDCKALEDLDLSSWNCQSLSEEHSAGDGVLYSTFDGCESLKTIDVSGFNTTDVHYANYMFHNCKALESIPGITDWDADELWWMTSMFDGCSSLKTLDLSHWEPGDTDYMFDGCDSLESLDLSGWDGSKLSHDYIYTLENLPALTSLKSPKTLLDKEEEWYEADMFVLPAKSGYAWYLDDNNDLVADDETTYTDMINPVTNESHHYIRSDIEGFSLQSNPEEHALKFSSDANFTLKADFGKTWDGTLEYTIDNGYTWTTWDGSQLSGTADQPIYLRGIENTVITGNRSACYLFMTGSNVECHGNIENLLDYQTVANGEHPTMGDYCYYDLFNYCTPLVTAPELSATTLAKSCYGYMFQGCTSLATAPELPATTLADYCYDNMFNGCTSLTTAPELPATTLAEYCYYRMFYNCASLTTVPELPATMLASYCYKNMFQGCTSLATAPELPATTLADYCYDSMFNGCTSLTTAPELPATTLAEYCYRDMFEGCTSLAAAPALPATRLVSSCYKYMFKGCTSLATAPELPATTLAIFCYDGMFSGCTSLTTVPELPATTLASYCYRDMFDYCTSLKLSTTKTGIYQYPYRIPMTGTGATAANALQNMFTNTGGTFTGTPVINTTYYVPFETELSHILNAEGAESLEHALKFSSDANFTLKANNGKTWDGTLEYSTDNGYTWTTWDGSQLSGTADQPVYLRGIGNTVITGNSYANNWVMTGSNVECHGNIENLLDYQAVANGEHPTMDDDCYNHMFYNCASLTTAPELPATTLANRCYYDMFCGCTSLTTAPELPATTLTNGCYYRMFNGCTALTTAPELPATTLAGECYAYMFSGCTSLTTAPELPATTLAYGCYKYMFKGCTFLTTVPELPATTLAYNSCYYGMFSGCTSLTTAPELSATTLANSCYYSMFSGCTSLTTAPELPAATLAEGCYYSMFSGCTSLTTAPELPATTLANRCYYDMFGGCTSLKLSATQTGIYQYPYRIPMTGAGTTATDALTDMFAGTGGTFTGTPEINTTYYVPFETDLSRPLDAAESLEHALKFSSDANFTLEADNGRTWNGTLEYTINNGYTWTTWTGSKLSGTVDQPIYLRGIENTVITGNSYANKWVMTGSNVECHGNIENLLDYQTVANGEHPTMDDYCYNYMFYGCTSLTTAPELPATTLANSCYANMFGRTSIATAPELSATTLTSCCYYDMFYGCTSLKLSATKTDIYQYPYRIPMTGTGTTATVALTNMFTNTGGTFTGTPAINTTYYVPFKTSLGHEVKYYDDINKTTLLYTEVVEKGSDATYEVGITEWYDITTDSLADLTNIQDDREVYAHIPSVATITYINGTNTIHEDTVNVGDTYTLIQTTPVQANKRFVGWQYNSIRYNSGAEFGVVNENITFTAEFVDTVTVTYKYYDRRTRTDITFKTETVDKGANYVLTTEIPEYDGQTDDDSWHSIFKKWGTSSYSSSGYAPGETYGVIYSNLTLYALYEAPADRYMPIMLDALILDDVGESKEMTPIETTFGTPMEYVVTSADEIDAYSYDATEVYNKYKDDFSTDIPSFSMPGKYTVLMKIQGANGLYDAHGLVICPPLLNVYFEIADEYQNGISFGDVTDAQYIHPEKANDIVKVYNAETNEQIAPVTIEVFDYAFNVEEIAEGFGGIDAFNELFPYCQNAEKVIAFTVTNSEWTFVDESVLPFLEGIGKFNLIMLPALQETFTISANNVEKTEGEDAPELTYEATGSFISCIKVMATLDKSWYQEDLDTMLRMSGSDFFKLLENSFPEYDPLISLEREAGETSGEYVITPSITSAATEVFTEIAESLNVEYETTIEPGTFTIFSPSSYVVTVPATLTLETNDNRYFSKTAEVNVTISSNDPAYHVYITPESEVVLRDGNETHTATMDASIDNDDFTYQTSGMAANNGDYSMTTTLRVNGEIEEPGQYNGNLSIRISSGKE